MARYYKFRVKAHPKGNPERKIGDDVLATSKNAIIIELRRHGYVVDSIRRIK